MRLNFERLTSGSRRKTVQCSDCRRMRIEQCFCLILLERREY